MSNIFWIYNPFVLIDKRYIKDLWPRDDMNDSEKLNSITRLIIILTILSYLLTNSYFSLLSGLVAVILIVGYYKRNEGFMSIASANDKESNLVSLGHCSLINHSEKKQNCTWNVSKDDNTITFYAIKPIKKGEELYTNYGKEYWNNKINKV